MKAKEFQSKQTWIPYVRDCVENEGFDYCFINYSHFDDIQDDKFHVLRNDYILAQKKLSEYLGFVD